MIQTKKTTLISVPSILNKFSDLKPKILVKLNQHQCSMTNQEFGRKKEKRLMRKVVNLRSKRDKVMRRGKGSCTKTTRESINTTKDYIGK